MLGVSEGEQGGRKKRKKKLDRNGEGRAAVDGGGDARRAGRQREDQRDNERKNKCGARKTRRRTAN